MNRTWALLIIIFSLLVSGCGSSWVKINGASAESPEVEAAKAKCQIDDKIYKLSYQETATEAAIQSISDEASKEDLREGFRMKEKKIYAEIDACMENEGFMQKQ